MVYGEVWLCGDCTIKNNLIEGLVVLDYHPSVCQDGRKDSMDQPCEDKECKHNKKDIYFVYRHIEGREG